MLAGSATPLAILDQISSRLADTPPIDLIAKLMPRFPADAITWARRLPHWDEYRGQHTDQVIALARVISRRAMREFGLAITKDGRVVESNRQTPRSQPKAEMAFPLVVAGQEVQVQYTPSYFPLMGRDDFSFTAESNPLSETGHWHQFVDHDAVEAIGGPEAFAALCADAKVNGHASEFLEQFEGRFPEGNPPRPRKSNAGEQQVVRQEELF